MLTINLICMIIFLIASAYLITAMLYKHRGQESGMARIWLSEIANDIRGSIKNHTYSIWKGLNYIRQKAASITNPCSADQANIRAKTTQTSKRWYDDLTQGQRDLWAEYAGALTPKEGDGGGTRQIIPDNRGVMSGFNAYIMLNLLAYSAGVTTLITFIDDAPVGITPPNAPTVLAAAWDVPTCCITVTWTDPVDAIAGTIIRIWTVSLNGGAHKQLVGTVALAAETYALCAVKGALGASFNVRDLPGNYLVQIDAVGPNGQKSPPSRVGYLAVPADCTPV